MENRFVTRPLTVQEMIWHSKFLRDRNDIESLVLFVESRRADPNLNVRDIPCDEFAKLLDECAESLKVTETLMVMENKINAEQQMRITVPLSTHLFRK